ncbi:hypothetical protein EEJ31_09835 [Cryobacterium tepidiphilum]|uniref:Uncharacterized protein n=1 Tax=Cryobacterium tepidiphilum TaxID=2486026 RepID=A0A3M8L1U0_9MICO|nr:hypothetical protein EEJ31_09835 [Cryobacterium tepidiphilum]
MSVRRPAVRTVLLLLSLVAALIIGLLAMHTFTSSIGGHGHSVAVSAPAHAGVTHDAKLAGAGDAGPVIAQCFGTCGSDADMAMACVLALLVTTLLLSAATGVRAWLSSRRVWPAAARTIAFAAQPMPTPPDLHALSISRT